MTTIAANLECMAADRRVSDSDENDAFTGWSYPARKIFRIGNSLYGTSGHGSMCLVFIEWLKTNRSRHALYRILGDEDRCAFRVLELRSAPHRRGKATLHVWDGWGIPEQVLADHIAVGSGAKAACALLDKGEGPEGAIRGAMPHDFFTGGPIDVEWLLPRELLPARRKR